MAVCARLPQFLMVTDQCDKEPTRFSRFACVTGLLNIDDRSLQNPDFARTCTESPVDGLILSATRTYCVPFGIGMERMNRLLIVLCRQPAVLLLSVRPEGVLAFYYLSPRNICRG